MVDSGSDDGTLDIIEGEDVVLEHVAKDDFSFGRSLNIGCGAASGEFLVFISAHCFTSTRPGWRDLLPAFDDEKVAVVYGKQRGASRNRTSWATDLSPLVPRESVPSQDRPISDNANTAIEGLLWESHPYDETLTGLKDVAWAQRVMHDGWWVSYRADAGVVHVHNETPSQIRNRYRREAITFQKVFPGEHFNAWDFIRLSSRDVVPD